MWVLQDRAAGETSPVLTALDAAADFFSRDRPVHVARAPGRLDVMGGHADYSGSRVLELPLAVAAFAAVQELDEPDVVVRSPMAAELGADVQVRVPLGELAPGGTTVAYPVARELLRRSPGSRWAAYVIGALVVLSHEKGAGLRHGLRILIESNVPPGKGVSSSAALGVSTMLAVSTATGVPLEGRELALLCERLENLVVGAPCGVMDPMTSACGEPRHLMALRCQPAELEGHVAIPAELRFWGIDSGIRHEVGGPDFAAVRVAAYMGYRIVADLAELPVRPSGPGRVEVDDPRWHGYLANVPPSEWESTFRDHIPEKLNGQQFLDRYSGITDSATSVEPGGTYAVRPAAEHPVYEHHRVRLMRAILQAPSVDEEARALLGELMYQSHASYGACGLGSSGTDRLVQLVRSAGAGRGLYGAKITGGGSGGVVAVLGRADAGDAIAEIAAAYETETGRTASVLEGSSAGALAFGTHLARWAA